MNKKAILLLLNISFLLSVSGQDYFVTAPYTSPSRNTCGAINNCALRTSEDHEYQVTIPSNGTWTFSLCGSSYDTWLAVGTALCTSNIAFNDDFCGLQSEVSANITAGIYYVTVEGFSGCGTYVLDIYKTGGPGESCANPIVIPSLPFSQTGKTTCGFGDDYSSLDACLSSYMNGDDFVYEYTPSSNQTISVTLSNTGSYTGVFITQGCPDVGTCIAYDTQSGGNPSICAAALTGGVTYYIIVSTWPSPQCTAFDIDVQTTVGVGSGTTCANATVIGSLPYNQAGLTTCCFGDDYSSLDACSSSYMNGDDYVFRYTPSSNQSIDITLTNTGTWCGVFVTQGCPNTGTCVDYDTQSGGNPTLSCVALTGGITYYIIVSSSPSPQCIPFDISITQSLSTAPDCNLNYAWSLITYSPYNYNTGTVLSFPDDQFAPGYTPLGFDFCFDGVKYNQILVSSNAYILFPSCYTNVPNGSPLPGGYSPWDIDLAIPNTTDAPTNAVLGPWHDINPGAGGTIRYQKYGVTPNQVFVVKYVNIPMFDCELNSSLNFNGEIMLYETSNLIEVHLGTKRVCSTWPTDVPETAILGLHNYNGTLAVVPTGTNYPNSWTATNQAVRFTPTCPSCNSILPIDLLSFTAERINDYIELKWETASEKNADYYVLQKSGDRDVFSDIATIQAVGNSTTISSYAKVDNNPLDGINYYRLKEVDRDGKTTFSNVVQEMYLANSEFAVSSIYPNPAVDDLFIDINSRSSMTLLISVNDITGRQVMTTESNIGAGFNNIVLNISELPRGWYSLTIGREDQVLEINNFIVK